MILREAKQICSAALFPKPYPTKAWVGLTERCNSHCKTCSIWKTKPNLDEVTPDEYYKLFSDPFLSHVDGIILSGGEITLRDDIVQCCLAIHRALPKAALTFSTNGLQPYSALETVGALLKQGIPLNVGTSLDHMVREKHDAIRGTKGSYDNVMQLFSGLRALRHTYPNLSVSFGCVLQKDNADNIPELQLFAKDNGFTILVQWMNRSGFYHNQNCTGLLKEEEYTAVEKLPDDYYSLKGLWLDWLDGEQPSFKCAALENWFVLHANGDVCPCLSKWDTFIGNVRWEPIKYIFERRPRCIDECEGCLNSWAVGWSAERYPYDRIRYYLKHPRVLLSRLL